MTNKERIMKAIEVLKGNKISGRIQDVYIDEYNNNVVYIKIKENDNWDISNYTINIRSRKVA